MKVLMVTPFPIDSQTIEGGVQAVAYYLSQGLTNTKEIDLHVLIPLNGPGYFKYKEKKENSGFDFDDRIKIHLYRNKRFQTLTNYFLDKKFLIQKIKSINPDIVHAQGSGRNSIVAALSGYPSVTTLHGVFKKEEVFYRNIHEKLSLKLRSLHEKKIFKKIKNLIIINKYVAEEIDAKHNANLFYINNPIKDDFFKIQREPIRQRLLFPNGIRERKDLVTLLKAMKILRKKFPSFSLHITGMNEGKEYFDKIVQLVNQYDLSNNIEILGTISEDRLFEEYRDAEILVMSSLEETSPMAIEQAMACGLPVVSTRAGGVPYMIEHKKTGLLVDIGDAGGIANMIELLFHNETLKNEIIKNTKLKAMKEYHIDSIIKETINTYKTILEQN